MDCPMQASVTFRISSRSLLVRAFLPEIEACLSSGCLTRLAKLGSIRTSHAFLAALESQSASVGGETA